MSIAAGAHLGHYEIRSALGAGGQGEVYKAVDVTLDRPVVIKVLSPEQMVQVLSPSDLRGRVFNRCMACWMCSSVIETI